MLDNGLGPYRLGVDPEFEWYEDEDVNQDGLVCTKVPETTTPVEPEPEPERTNDEDPGEGGCHPSYPDSCIPAPPPDLDCRDVPDRDFTVLPPDPHRFDGDDGVGCEE